MFSVAISRKWIFAGSVTLIGLAGAASTQIGLERAVPGLNQIIRLAFVSNWKPRGYHPRAERRIRTRLSRPRQFFVVDPPDLSRSNARTPHF